MDLHDYQHKAIDFAITREKSFMAIDLGLGKTAIALKAMEQWKTPSLVLAPLRVIYTTWPDEIKNWTPNQSYQVLHGAHKDTKLQYNADIYLLNYDGIKWFHSQAVKPGRIRTKFNLIIDESTFVKSPSTKRFKLLKKMMPLFNDNRMCLSATPAPNGYQDLWSQYFMLDEGQTLDKSFYRYRDRFFFYTGPPMYITTIKPNATQDIQKLIAPRTFRLDQKDYLELPEYIHNEIPVILPPKTMKQYKSLEKDFILDIQDQPVTAFNSAALSMKLRQLIQGGLYLDEGGYASVHTAKIDALKEIIEGAPDQPILCPIQFKFEYHLLQKSLKKTIPIIAGRTSIADSIKYIKEWNEGKIPLLLCHPASIGHGLNLQATGHIICWYGLPWSLEQYQQLIGRIYRQGQKHAVTVHHLVAKDTVDAKVLKVLKRKGATQQDLLDALRSLT